jgi:hypothetical protein
MFTRRFYAGVYFAPRYFPMGASSSGPLPPAVPAYTAAGVTEPTLLDEIVTRTQIIEEEVCSDG